MIIRRFALIFGVVFLLVGLAGFLPGVVVPHTHPDVSVTAGLGLVFGLFPVNVLHDLVHLAFGVWGLVASRSDPAALVYARIVAIAYAVLAVMGLVTAGNLHTTFGLVPLYGHDIWLHAALALVAGYFGYLRQETEPALER